MSLERQLLGLLNFPFGFIISGTRSSPVLLLTLQCSTLEVLTFERLQCDPTRTVQTGLRESANSASPSSSMQIEQCRGRPRIA